MIKENEQNFIQIYSNDTFDVYYDKDTKRYHIDVFDDGHYWDEVWFEEYKEDITIDFKPLVFPDDMEDAMKEAKRVIMTPFYLV